MNVLQTYLHDLRLVHATGAGVAETSYYPAVKALLDTVGNNVSHCGSKFPAGILLFQGELECVCF